MRIIAGTLSGRKIDAPAGRTTRPMTDRVREGLFNILAHHDWGKSIGDPIEGADVLDAFCGTGALSFEALSRGARHATLFDKDREALRTAKNNAAALGVEQSCTIMPMNALSPIKAPEACRLVFLAPPYRKGLVVPALTTLTKTGWIADNALIVIETAKGETLDLPDNVHVLAERLYGDTALAFAGF